MTYTIEVIIAISILAAVVVFLFGTAPQASLDLEKQSSYDALEALNADGALREAVVGEDVGKAKALLDRYFTNYDIEICSDVCFGTAVRAQIVEYYISGFHSTYSPKKLRIFLFEA
jgi:hypothetical protein